MSDNNLIGDTLKKKAVGFSEDEIVEEYVLNADGELVLSKKKVTKKYYPPDLTALKALAEETDVSALTDEELIQERERLLKTLGNQDKKE